MSLLSFFIIIALIVIIVILASHIPNTPNSRFFNLFGNNNQKPSHNKSSYDSYMETMGRVGEDIIFDLLDDWSCRQNANSRIRCISDEQYGQPIDILYESERTPNLAIEVKNLKKRNFISTDIISRWNQNGRRQSDNQLHGFIRNNECLGLYAIILREGEMMSICFIPHYAINLLIRQYPNQIPIDKITNHPKHYDWYFGNSNNDGFFDFIDTQYEKQNNFLYN